MLLLSARPVVTIASVGATFVSVSWTQPSGGRVDSYTLHYNTTVISCNEIQMHDPVFLSNAIRSYVISGLEEDSEVSGRISLTNPGGSIYTLFTSRTLTASKYVRFRGQEAILKWGWGGLLTLYITQ